MEPKYLRTPMWLRLVASVTCLVFVTGCATRPPGASPEDIAAIRNLREARSANLPAEERAADYLEAAALTAPRLGSGTQPTSARETYNAAAGELTILLRSADGGRLWNHPLTLTSGNETYHLRLQPGDSTTWSPNYFTSFTSSKVIKKELVRKDIAQAGVGGSLVGVRAITPPEKFAPPRGIAAAVTATLDFKKNDASLALRRPDNVSTASSQGMTRPLAADFSAAVAYYRPPSHLFLFGIMGALRSENYMEKTGLYFLEPYDPDRIPVVFVHGLISTPFTWFQAINELQADPEIRKRYQFWVFGYPTGNPILYSALRLREELAKVDQLYPNHRPYVLVGHSMGGLLAQLQVTTVTPEMWEKQMAAAKSVLTRNSPNSLVVRSMTFQANPRVRRVVFVCAPHRGSELATGSLGRMAMGLLKLPGTLATSLRSAVTATELKQLTGDAEHLPNSIMGLKPENPALKVFNSAPMTVPYHSIIGDRGKGNSPNSSDGVVPYWSSHLSGAKSECIVPGPHSSCELPETIAEIHRILRLHLAAN